MTQAFCQLVLHYSVARLSWKTIKSLRRSRFHLRKCGAGNDSVSAPTLGENNEDVPPVEYEILQGWTVLAFHTLYDSSGIEYFVRFVVPFYFHLKMMVLFATFVVPSWAGRNGGGDGTSEFGLSPLISYWFDYVIVPGVHKVHDLMDQDPKGWVKRHAMLLPFYFIDYFVFPGILTTDEEKQLVRKTRIEDGESGGDSNNDNLPSDQCFNPSVSPDDRTILGEINANTLRNSCTQKSSARKKQLLGEGKLAAEQPGDRAHETPCGQKLSPLYSESTPNSTRSPSLPRNTPVKSHTDWTKETSYSLSMSPSDKSRLASSTRRLKRFSLEHQNKGRLVSPIKNRRRVKTDVSEPESAKQSVVASPSKNYSDQGDETRSPARKARRRRRRERRSFGDQLRELVTGDSTIRVRDHLFDLDLPSSPRGHHSRTFNSSKSHNVRDTAAEEQSQTGNSNVAMRRSSRLAKKKNSSRR